MTMALQQLLGDPWDPDNPLGHEAVVAADEAGQLPPGGEELLDSYGLGAEFVPAALGGRLTDVDAMARGLRPLFGRDGALGLGYGVTTIMAAVNVWTSGDPEQQRRLADTVLAGGRAAVCFHELAHGNDFGQQEFAARPENGSLVLNGRKEVINNVGRARALVLFARTDPGAGSRSHSLLLVDPAAVAPASMRPMPRFGTVGVRGCELGGVEFTDCRIPESSLIGPPGSGMETALRAFQITRAALPSMALGTLDTQLRVTVRFARERRLYGATVAELPHARSLLATAFTGLLTADCLTTAACRALHLLPGEAGPYAAAAKYLGPRILLDASDGLSVVLGARHYLREGPYAIFQKHLRDLPVLSLGHAGPLACLASVVPQLPALARQSWANDGPPPPDALFAAGGPLPPLRYDRLALSARGRDPLGAAWPALGRAVLRESGESGGHLGTLVRLLTARFRELAHECAELPRPERTVTAGPQGFGAAAQYAALLAAAACAGTWLDRRRHSDPFLGGTAWLTAALHRLAERLGSAPGQLPTAVEDELLAELFNRHDRHAGFDLDRLPLA
ncbi:acyl-CoA dehydrogenase [Streptomyces coacervatus]|uniref:Acyl-CoA dehydrogenase n=1 Tax=Streptomyces coacervatus TaxID=647381 RepID=A0ABP7IRA9_9ACTN|nr:acyl-CoA dehydrogenase [Streptomyces coacervatus]MDF2266824.1 acyl-CoA dehydrogenase [Streptomyces coacervatus]